MTDQDYLVTECIIWDHVPQIRPGISLSTDGRVRVEHDGQILELPNPARQIYEDAIARKAVANLP